MDTISQLEKEIAEKQKLIRQLKKTSKSEAIKELSEYTVEEKVKFFDDTYASALSMLNQKENDEIGDEVETQYDWEANMELLAKDHDKFWKYWNSLPLKQND